RGKGPGGPPTFVPLNEVKGEGTRRRSRRVGGSLEPVDQPRRARGLVVGSDCPLPQPPLFVPLNEVKGEGTRRRSRRVGGSLEPVDQPRRARGLVVGSDCPYPSLRFAPPATPGDLSETGRLSAATTL